MADVELVEASDTFTHVKVRGDLDERGVAELDVKLTCQTVARRHPVILDLSDVGLITSLGIGLLVSIARSLRSLGLGLVVVVGAGRSRTLLEMTNINALVPLAHSRDDALRALDLS